MFKWSENSENKLVGIKLALRMVADKALSVSAIDFAIINGVRTLEEEQQLFKEGNSKTEKSKHLTGEAIDVCPWVNSELAWNDIEAFFKVVVAFEKAAEQLKIGIRWGGAWVKLNNLMYTYESAIEHYKEWCKEHNEKPLIDLGHFELLGE